MEEETRRIEMIQHLGFPSITDEERWWPPFPTFWNLLFAHEQTGKENLEDVVDG